MCKSVHQVTKVTLSHFQQALELTQHQDYQITYDLNVAYYHHTKIYWTQTKFLGADISKPNGETQCFISLFLPLRLSSAVHCITKILKPINGYLHEKGVRHLRTYFFLRRQSNSGFRVQSRRASRICLRCFAKVWIYYWSQEIWSKRWGKSMWGVLGLHHWHQQHDGSTWRNKKAAHLAKVKNTIDYGSNLILARDLASTLGKIVAMEPALGPVVVIAARAVYVDLDMSVQKNGWGTRLVMTKSPSMG